MSMSEVGLELGPFNLQASTLTTRLLRMIKPIKIDGKISGSFIKLLECYLSQVFVMVDVSLDLTKWLHFKKVIKLFFT